MRRPPHLLLLAALVFASYATTPTMALAEDATASALIEQGLDLRQSGHDVEALALFQKAQTLAPSPRGQAQVALAEQALGRWGLAERELSAALGAKGDAWIESRRPILERAMSVIRDHLGDVEIVGAHGGSVFVDGVRIEEPGALSHLRLEVGRRTFELRTPGWYPFSRVLDVLPGERVRVEVDQHPLLEGEKSPANAPASVASAPAVTKTEPGRAQRTSGWIVLSGAAVFLATGTAALIIRQSDATSFNATCSQLPSNNLTSQCSSWLSGGSTAQTLEIVGFVGAGVFGALSAALLLTAPSAKSKSTTLSFPCSPTRGGAWCAFGGAF